jgi:aminoglycoside 6'-N-acetyltransferase
MSSGRPDRPSDGWASGTRPRQPAELVGRSVVVVPVGPEHVEALVRILAEPSVARWWNEPPEEARTWLLEPDEGEIGFAILDAGERQVIGYIQAAEESTPMYRHAGIDLFLTTDRQGQGIGPEAIRLLAHWLIEERGHHRLTIDPAADNVRAIRAYEKLGFRPVGIMRQYERGPDGTWHDGLLMDLLAWELAPR